MTQERRWILLGLAAVLLLIACYLVAKRIGVFDTRADQILIYKTVDGHALELHLFRPRGRPYAGNVPTLLLFHGGAWQYGAPSQFYPQCEHFRDLGLLCICAQYRIASVHGTDPRASVRDARDSIRFLRRHSAELGLDPERIVVGGGSAGGHLAAALGTALPLSDSFDEATASVRPNALILYNPMLDLSPGMPDHELVEGYWNSLSPLHHIDQTIPPTLILCGTDDPEVTVETVAAFCAEVRAVGERCESVFYEGATHGFFNPSVEDGRYFRLTNQAVEGFLERLGYLNQGH